MGKSRLKRIIAVLLIALVLPTIPLEHVYWSVGQYYYLGSKSAAYDENKEDDAGLQEKDAGSITTGIKKIGDKKYYIKKGVIKRKLRSIVKVGKTYYVVDQGVIKRRTSKRCNKILALQKKYPEGRKWTNRNKYLWKSHVQGYGCAAFSFIASDAAYGKKAKVVRHRKFGKVKSGDILRLDYDTHSVVVLEKLSKGVIVAEGNYNSTIHWFRYISMKNIRKTGIYVETRKK